ncbi:MAG TPA: sortase [Acidimicrobiales bacterium]|nr:sortase [Acidimicrobiales bacterium]
MRDRQRRHRRSPHDLRQAVREPAGAGAGHEIILETPIGSCRYVLVAQPFVVSPTDTHVVDPTEHGQLTLTTCHPKGSARQRLVVQAVLQTETATPA